MKFSSVLYLMMSTDTFELEEIELFLEIVSDMLLREAEVLIITQEVGGVIHMGLYEHIVLGKSLSCIPKE
jgi:hypothetical protein